MAHAFESVVFYRCSHCGNVVAKVIDQGYMLIFWLVRTESPKRINL